MKRIAKIFTIVCLGLIIVPFSVQAFSFDDIFDGLDEFFSGQENNSVQITNEINVSANTGGNKSEGGQVIEGQGKTEVEIKTIINGEEIEPVEIETEASEVNVSSEIKADDEIAHVEREVEIDSEKTTESHDIDLQDANASIKEATDETQTGSEGVINSVQNWWSDFVEEVKSFFQNIFDLF